MVQLEVGEVERTFRAWLTNHSRTPSIRLFLDKPSGILIISASVSVLTFTTELETTN